MSPDILISTAKEPNNLAAKLRDSAAAAPIPAPAPTTGGGISIVDLLCIVVVCGTISFKYYYSSFLEVLVTISISNFSSGMPSSFVVLRI